MKKLTQNDLEHIAHGAALLGSGGGGALSTALELVKGLSTSVTCVTVEEALEQAQSASACAAMVAYIGSPDSATHMERPHGAVNALRILDSLSGGRLQYVIPAEVGPVNTLVACLAAADLGISVLDADGAGRAVPALPMLTFAHVEGLSPQPAVLATEGSQAVTLQIDNATDVEKFARPIIAVDDYGQKAGLAMWAMTKEQMERALVVRGTLSLAQELGILLGGRDPVPAVSERLMKEGMDVQEIFRGRIERKENATGGGFDSGRVVLANSAQDQRAVVYFLNENLIAWSSDQQGPMAWAPSSIAYVTSSGHAFTNADITDGDNSPTPTIATTPEAPDDVHLLHIAPHPDLIESQPWEAISRAFAGLLLEMGYPLPALPHEAQVRAAKMRLAH
jgi:DUF917 family protein